MKPTARQQQRMPTALNVAVWALRLVLIVYLIFAFTSRSAQVRSWMPVAIGIGVVLLCLDLVSRQMGKRMARSVEPDSKSHIDLS